MSWSSKNLSSCEKKFLCCTNCIILADPIDFCCKWLLNDHLSVLWPSGIHEKCLVTLIGGNNTQPYQVMIAAWYCQNLITNLTTMLHVNYYEQMTERIPYYYKILLAQIIYWSWISDPTTMGLKTGHLLDWNITNGVTSVKDWDLTKHGYY